MASDGFLPPPDHVSRPQHQIPAGATDCHAHVFGPFDRFPLVEVRSYTPPELPGERYLGMLDELGFSRGVLVQPTPHGTDCRAMLNAIQSNPARLRGIGVVQPEIPDDELEMMKRQGVRGLRFCRPPGTVYKGWIGFEALEQMAPRLRDLGLHAQVWSPCDLLMESMPRLLSFGLPLVVDHMSYFDVSQGVSDPAFQGVLRLLAEGRIWLKLGSFRLSKRYPDYDDVIPFHEALIAANAERLLWGSDWPHVHLTADMPDAGHLVDLLASWTDDEKVLRKILVDNPAKLYGF